MASGGGADSTRLWDKDNPEQQGLVCLNKSFKNLLNKEAVRLCDLLTMSSMWPVLRQLEVVSEKQEQDMKLNASNYMMVRHLINHINKGPLWWMHSFFRACVVSNQAHILKVLKVDSKPYDDTLLRRPYRIGSAHGIVREPWRRDNPRQQSLVRENVTFKSVLNKKRVELCDAMEMASLWPVLRQLEVISAKEEEEMKLNTTNSQMVHLLIDHINKGPMWKLHGLLQACTVSNQTHILDLLQVDSELYDITQLEPCQQESDSLYTQLSQNSNTAHKEQLKPRTAGTSHTIRSGTKHATNVMPREASVTEGSIVEAVEDYDRDSRNDVYFLKGDKMVVLDASSSLYVVQHLTNKKEGKIRRDFVVSTGEHVDSDYDVPPKGMERNLAAQAKADGTRQIPAEYLEAIVSQYEAILEYLPGLPKMQPLLKKPQLSKPHGIKPTATKCETSDDEDGYINTEPPWLKSDNTGPSQDKNEPESDPSDGYIYSAYHPINTEPKASTGQHMFKAMCDSGKGSGHELEFKAGDLIVITSDAHCLRGDSWWLGTHVKTGKTGYIPNNYLQYERTIDPSMLDLMKERELSRSSPVSEVQGEGQEQKAPPRKPRDPVTEEKLESGTIIKEKHIAMTHSGDLYFGHWKDKRNVAIKCIQNDIENYMINEDVQAVAQLDHSNVVKLWDAFQEKDIIYIITEYACHGHLLNFLKQGDGQYYKLPELVDIAAQIAGGMKYLEDNNYIHRQLKACNVLVATNGCVKVYIKVVKDVVYANLLREGQGEKLSIRWTAPEALEAVPTKKSVVWSYGILLYELFTCGSYPFRGKNDPEVIALIQEGTNIRKYIPKPKSVPEDLYQLMLRCLAKTETNRPSFEQLLEIRRFSVGEGENFQYPIQNRLNLRGHKKDLNKSRDAADKGEEYPPGYEKVCDEPQYIDFIPSQHARHPSSSAAEDPITKESPFLLMQEKFLQSLTPPGIYANQGEYEELPDVECHTYAEVYEGIPGRAQHTKGTGTGAGVNTQPEYRKVLPRPEPPPKSRNALLPTSKTSGIPKYPYTLLISGNELEGVDLTQKEKHLTDQEFHQIFNMTYEAFSALPMWRRVILRKLCGLYHSV